MNRADVSDAGGLKSASSGLGALNRDHPLVRHVQQNVGIQDPGQATQYTQHGVNLLNEQVDKDPKGTDHCWAASQEEAVPVIIVVSRVLESEICLVYKIKNHVPVTIYVLFWL